MKNRTSVAAVLVSGMLALLLSGPAAADWSWNFTGSYTGNSSGMTFSGSGGAPSVTASGWSNSVSASRTSSNYGTGDLVQRTLKRYSGGLGVESLDDVGQGSPEHATDNQYRIDSILLNFGGSTVTLDQVRFGWYSGDSDFSLAAYTGGGSTDLTAMGYAQLASNGWATIDSYYNSGTSSTAVNAGNVSSSYWLISALNPNLGGINNTNFYSNDFFKLASAGGVAPPTTTSVPEPSTLLLLGGVLLITVVRARTANSRQEGDALQA